MEAQRIDRQKNGTLMAVQLITDSTVDMAARVRDRASVVPLRISFCERDYIDGVTLTRIKNQNKTETGIRQGEEPFVCRCRQRDPLPFLLLPPFSINQFPINPFFRFINHN